MISITDGLRCYYNSNMKEKTPLELERENRILQSNWNSLREYCEENKYFYSGYQGEDREEDLAIMGVLDKMNELEGKNKE